MDSALTIIPFSNKIAAPGAVKIYEGREVVKVLKDPIFGELRIFKTNVGRRGFWEDEPAKVQKLIDAFKAGHNIKNACIYAGISEFQWLRFNDAYPTFRSIKEACESVLSFTALKTVAGALDNKPDLAFKYARERGDFNFKPSKVGDERPLQPTVQVGVQVNNHIDNERAIEDRARIRLTTRVSERPGTVQETRDPAMAAGV